MNEIEKIKPQLIQSDVAYIDSSATTDNNPMLPILMGMLRRWYIILLVFLIISGVGVPAIWYGKKPTYTSVGAIRVAPILTNLITGEKDSGNISNYQMFMNTQADLLRRDHVIQSVADELSGYNLSFFPSGSDPVNVLRQMLDDKTINVGPEKNTELLKITMIHTIPNESKKIVNAFIHAYMAIDAADENRGGGARLAALEVQRQFLQSKIEMEQQAIKQLGLEYGSVDLISRQEMMLQKELALRNEITRLEIRSMDLEIRQKLLSLTQSEKIPTNELIRMRNAHTNDDLTIQALVNNISEQEQLLIFERQTKAPTHPDLKFREDLIKALRQNMEKRREGLGKEFDESIEVELSRNNVSKLESVKIELDQTRYFLETYKKMLQDEENATLNVGRIQLDIQDLSDKLYITKDMYDRVRKAIQEVELESKRPARVSVYYEANTGQLQDKRKQLILATLMGALACGAFLSFLKTKWDVLLRIPEDVIRYIDVPVIGTTTSMHRGMQEALPERIADDYQNIRANLGLVTGQGIPEILAVTSPGIREGKTTFAINLAASMAKAGSRVLLIDGDFRKPDIKNVLSINGKSGGLQKVLFGTCGIEQAVVKLPEIGLHVLTADPFNISGTFEILARTKTKKIM
ncbi:MAG: AAA family ATPase, partial [Planctomycetes bacterium]|nr:AAA family ATPase [Planctomycetota bacterium]